MFDRFEADAASAGSTVDPAAVQEAFEALLGCPVGKGIKTALDCKTRGKAGSDGYNMRRALAARGIWTRSETLPRPKDTPKDYAEKGGQYGYRLKVVAKANFVDANEDFAEVEDAKVTKAAKDNWSS